MGERLVNNEYERHELELQVDEMYRVSDLAIHALMHRIADKASGRVNGTVNGHINGKAVDNSAEINGKVLPSVDKELQTH